MPLLIDMAADDDRGGPQLSRLDFGREDDGSAREFRSIRLKRSHGEDCAFRHFSFRDPPSPVLALRTHIRGKVQLA